MNVSEARLELLTIRDIEFVAKVSERIHYTNSSEPFLNHSFVVLNDAIPRKIFSVDSYSINPVSFKQAVSEGVSSDLFSVYRAYMHQHPLLPHFLAPESSDVSTILTTTTADEFHQTDLYQEFYKVLGIEDQLAFALPHPQGIYVLVYSRETAFSEKEKVIMQLLKPQLQIALKNWQRIRELELHLRTLEENSVGVTQTHEAPGGWTRLSPRQQAVAELAALGLENRKIAEKLHISPKTVGKHLENIFEVLDIHNRTALAAMWSRQ
ncbi:response regulator transcription factor [Tichowtungia aerotolerans]|uniref:HTH luxR-type domain-containing protein n=1 Tax=Tichowtungia aerotolerans TaxID=2697043 RepID=A0A6P1M849_9BACT|nr:LuxR C-terminal-related transcriptional regulator [Tichowtungia aerotolerans]QHI70051.1 hypothetical protein GT409_11520 [Tichowtungia aerotolerans]